MGAFFLYRKFSNIDLPAVKHIFRNKGFDEPYKFDLGDSELLLYRKQLISEENYIIKDNYALFIIGTVIYKSANYTETKEKLLHDFILNKIDQDALQGNYCIIFFDGNKTVIMNDSMNVQHLFTDRDHQYITSSFLAAISAVKGKLQLNKMACYEKFSTGYIVGEDTIFKQVIHLTKDNQSKVINWNFVPWRNIEIPESFDKNGMKRSAAKQAEAIISYLKKIKSFAEQYKPEIGLSGGYDSRLLYAATFKAWPFKISVHTHATEGVAIHDIEKKIVKDMASQKNSPLRIVPTKSMESYSNEELEEIFKDGLYFFDGRCAYNMGAFSPVYTRKYKMEVVGDCRLTLNGLGGEIYRNYYMVSRRYINCEQWMKAHVYCQNIEDVFINKNHYKEMHAYICQKMSKELGFKWKDKVSNFKMRRYYSELRLPDCDALNCNAHNQISFYLTPFIERELVEKAYYGYKYIGISGEYQSEIMRITDYELADFPSHYGFSFSKREPFKYKLYMLIRGLLPDSIWNMRIKLLYGNYKEKDKNQIYFDKVLNKCDYLKRASEFTESLFPEINFNILRRDYAMMPNSSYLSILFYEFKDKLEH